MSQLAPSPRFLSAIKGNPKQPALEIAPVKKTLESPIPKKTLTQPQRKPLEPVAQPTLQDFISEAQKLGEERARAAGQVAQRDIGDVADAFSRRLFSQNVGATSGVGQQLAGREIQKFGERLEPVIKQIGLETAGQELDIQRQQEARNFQKAEQQAERAFQLVQSGQITGEQAKQSLIQQGIDPETFLTPEQLVSKQFETRKQQLIKDPNVSELIDNEEELNFYLENGKTMEDEISDIVRTRKSINEWKQALPTLRQRLTQIDQNIVNESKKNDGFIEKLAGVGRDDRKIEELKEQRNALEQIINEVEAGKNPVYDIEEFTSNKPDEQPQDDTLRKIAFGSIGGKN